LIRRFLFCPGILIHQESRGLNLCCCINTRNRVQNPAVYYISSLILSCSEWI